MVTYKNVYALPLASSYGLIGALMRCFVIRRFWQSGGRNQIADKPANDAREHNGPCPQRKRPPYATKQGQGQEVQAKQFHWHQDRKEAHPTWAIYSWP